LAGHLFVISAPSGTGKTTVIKGLLKEVSGLCMAVSYTTREPRTGEEDGVDYVFIDDKEFSSMIKKSQFVEWAEVHQHKYGTPISEIKRLLKGGNKVLLDIDTQGAENVKKKFPEAISIFLLPPSFDELEKRLRTRGQNSEKEMKIRIENAKEEYAKRHLYDYQVVNEDLGEAIDEISEIIAFCVSE